MSRTADLHDLVEKIENEIHQREFSIRFVLTNTLCGLTWNQEVRDALHRIVDVAFTTVREVGPEDESWYELDKTKITNEVALLSKYFEKKEVALEQKQNDQVNSDCDADGHHRERGV